MRFNPLYDTWVAVSENRQSRPIEFNSQKSEKGEEVREKTNVCDPNCPFCEGNELETPAEVDAIPQKKAVDGSELRVSKVEPEQTLDNYRRPNAPGWMVRSVPNRYPFIRPDTERLFQEFGPYRMAPNVGKQEVLVDVPCHGSRLEERSAEEFQYLVHFYHRRLYQLRREGRWKYIQLFKNQGPAAGASMTHLHSQIAALPFVPPSIEREQAFLARHRTETGKCYHCEVLEYELTGKWRLVEESDAFVVLCPFASRFAGEMQILPKRHLPCFLMSEREELDELAVVLRRAVRALERTFACADFNLVLRNSPWEYQASGITVDENFHWRLEICPRINRQAGFELGTGCYVNPTSPESAAAELACAIHVEMKDEA